MKVGDLIYYNCAGMKNHTMGYVMNEFVSSARHFFQIRWIKKGKFMPKFSSDYYAFRNLPQPWAERFMTGKTSHWWYERTELFGVIQ
tara:strand:+ start:487 stop:747 length:261 start_codon:yes stop_codon:yes gene_type:complete